MYNDNTLELIKLLNQVDPSMLDDVIDYLVLSENEYTKEPVAAFRAEGA